MPKSLDRCRNQWRTIIRNPPRVPKTPQKDKNPWGTFTKNFPCVPNSQFMGNNFKKSFLCFFKSQTTQYTMAASASIATVHSLSYLLRFRIVLCSVIQYLLQFRIALCSVIHIGCDSRSLTVLLFISAAAQDFSLFCYCHVFHHTCSCPLRRWRHYLSQFCYCHFFHISGSYPTVA